MKKTRLWRDFEIDDYYIRGGVRREEGEGLLYTTGFMASRYADIQSPECQWVVIIAALAAEVFCWDGLSAWLSVCRKKYLNSAEARLCWVTWRERGRPCRTKLQEKPRKDHCCDDASREELSHVARRRLFFAKRWRFFAKEQTCGEVDSSDVRSGLRRRRHLGSQSCWQAKLLLDFLRQLDFSPAGQVGQVNYYTIFGIYFPWDENPYSNDILFARPVNQAFDHAQHLMEARFKSLVRKCGNGIGLQHLSFDGHQPA